MNTNNNALHENRISELVNAIDEIGSHETDFYKWLRKHGILFQNNPELRKDYVARGFFSWKPSKVDADGGMFSITHIGKVWLASEYLESIDKKDAE